MRREREILESFNKLSEAIKHFEQLLKSPRSNNDTFVLGFTSTEEGESSKGAEERSDKGKNTKPTCHFYGKKGHTPNVCMSKKTNRQDKPKNKGHYHKCNKQGYRTQDYMTNIIRKPRFDAHYYNYKKYGHRYSECRSKPMRTPNQPIRRNNHANHYN